MEHRLPRLKLDRLTPQPTLQLLLLRFGKELNPLHHPLNLLLLLQLWLWLRLSLWLHCHQLKGLLLCLLNPFQHRQTEQTQ
jgi:hypothetical protein